MAVRIYLKSGAWHEVDAYYEDVLKDWSNENIRFVEYESLTGGFPKPKVAIDPKSIEHVMQVR